METYKTFKSSNEELKVEQFINQFSEIMTIVIINKKEYSAEKLESIEETEDEFFFEFGKDEDSIKAWSLISSVLNK